MSHDRRTFLELCAGAAGGLLLPACGVPSGEAEALAPLGPTKPPPRDWLRGARLAGLEVSADEPPLELTAALDRLAEEQTSVVELDGGLSHYLTPAKFDAHVAFLGRLAVACHQRGMRAVAYYPALEVLSPGITQGQPDMAKDHPDWVQQGIDGRPNVFVGAQGNVFWVEAGTQSAWMCPTSGYRDYFLGRVAALARTELDGLWLDVPLLSSIVGQWPCTNESCRRQFQQVSGLEAPRVVDWKDPTFRRWVAWRHELIWDFEQAALRAARAINPGFMILSETVTMDNTSATVQALDPASRDDGELIRVWEVDAVSDASSMRQASANDWLSMAAMMRYARGVSGARPSWIFCYGLRPDDAERVAALAVVTGNSPYETQIPRMCTSVGSDYRKQLFGWVAKHRELYTAPHGNSAAVVFSPGSRDFLGRAAGHGLYPSVRNDDPLWWSPDPEDATHELEYVGDYRGCCKALIEAHVPFDVVPSTRLRNLIGRYRLLVVPSPFALADDAIEALVTFVHGGGALVLTGDDGGTMNDLGTERVAPALLRGLELQPAEGGVVSTPRGRGWLLHVGFRMGRDLLQRPMPDLVGAIATLAGAHGARLTLTATEPLVLDLRRRSDGAPIVVMANLAGLGSGGDFSPHDVTFTIDIPIPPRRTAVAVTRAAFGEDDRKIPFQANPGFVTCQVDLRALTALTVEVA
jgi:hypothetical protein